MANTNMSPIGWALRPLKKYAAFSGRASRAEFCWFVLFVLILYAVMWFVFLGSLGGLAASEADPSAGMLGVFGGAGIAIVLFWLVLLIPTLAVQTRRLHDTNRSGWWLVGFYVLYAVYFAMIMRAASAAGTTDPSQGGMMVGAGLLGIVMMVYGIVLLVFYVLPGTRGPNRFGSDPYGEDVEKVFA